MSREDGRNRHDCIEAIGKHYWIQNHPYSQERALLAPLSSWVPRPRFLFIVDRQQGKGDGGIYLSPEHLPPRGRRKN